MGEIPQPGDTVGRYTIGERLGQGATGTVFRASRSLPRREVALKVIPAAVADPGFREQFLHEADLLAELNSPHIVAIHDVGEDDGFLFIATDLVPGGDLGSRLARGPVPLKPALTIAAQVASALSAAHARGVIHRDVKPSNVLLGERDGKPHAYLCDFGIAQPAGAGGTRRSVVVGTYAYLAPELLSGGAPSPASDVYALGCLLVAAITGNPPYAGTDQEIAQQHLTSEIPHWEETSPLLAELNWLVEKAMAKAPGDRFASADEFRTAILDVLGSVPEVASPAPAAPAAPVTPAEPAEPTPAVLAPAEPVPPVEPAADPLTDAAPLWAPAEEEPSPVAAEPPIWEAAPAYQEADAPVPDEPEWQERHWDEEPPKRSWTVLVSSILALLLVGGVVAAVVLLQDDDKDPAEAGPGATTSQTPTPTPGTTKVCQEGRTVEATERCGNPYGIPGLNYVFPGITGTCKDARLNTDKYWEISCSRGGGTTVTYSTFKTTPLSIQHNDELYTGQPTMLPSGLFQYGPEQLPNGNWSVSLAYPEKRPYGVQVVAPSRAAAQDVLDGIQVLPPEDFVDE